MGVVRAQTAIVLGQSAAAVSHTGDTSEFTLATITIPANAMGANGWIELKYDATQTSSQTLKIKFGGTQLLSMSSATTGYVAAARISNRGATNSQRFSQMRVQTSNSTAAGDTATATVDTTASVDLVITGTLSNAANTITLESYQVILYPKA